VTREKGIEIRDIGDRDIAAVTAVYNHYVRATTVTFEEQPVSDEEFSSRVDDVLITGKPWLVALGGEGILGYAFAALWRARSAYRFSAEVSVYLKNSATGQGVWQKLYRALFDRLIEQQTRSVIAVVGLPNEGSVKFHERFGFKKVAHLESVGLKFNRWLDVGYWQKHLDDRP